MGAPPPDRSTARGSRLTITVAGFSQCVGCGQLAGLDDYSVAADRGQQAPSPRCGAFDQGDCRTCVEESCCIEAESCRRDEACTAFMTCMTSCSEEAPGCRHECFTRHPKTAPAADLLACRNAKCGSRCQTCGDFGNVLGPDCNRCIATKEPACRAAAACLAESECAAWGGCTLRNSSTEWRSDPATRLDCWSDHFDGKATFNEYAREVTACANECGWGTHWQCSPAPQWRTPGGNESATVELVVVPFFGVPEPDVLVRACSGAGACEWEATTTADGATLTLPPAGPPGAGGYYYELSKPGLQRGLYYPWHSTVGTITGTIPAFAEGIAAALTSDNFDIDGGFVLVVASDCMGSLSIYDPASTGVTFSSDPVVDGPWYGMGLPDRNLKAGQMAYFFGIRGAALTIRGNDPKGRDFPPATVRVEPGVATIVNLNLQAQWL
jgi:hypothetical protein